MISREFAPMTPTTRSRLERSLLELYLKFVRDLRPGEPINVSVGGGRLLLEYVTDAVEPLTPCEEDIVTVLRRAGRKLTAKEIIAGFEGIGACWGNSTVWQALASLVAKGVLVNRKDKRGYSLNDTKTPSEKHHENTQEKA